MAPRVSILLLNWNQPDLTADCLRSLEKLPKGLAEVIVVDNGSVDDSVDRLSRDFPWMRLVRSPKNLGFTGGNNLGIAVAQGEFVLLLNNDTEVPPDFLDGLLAAADAHPEAGAFSPKIRYHHHPDRLQYAGGGGMDLRTGRGIGWRGDGQVDSGQFDDPCEVVSAHGAAYLVRREVLDQVGPLHDGYFIYYEELDWSERIRAAGWTIRYVPTSLVMHKESMTTGKDSPFKTYFMTRNRIQFVGRHGRWWERACFGLWVVGGVLPLHTIRHALTRRADLLRALWFGVLDGFTHRFGNTRRVAT